MRIIEIVVTRCQILRLKYTKFDFGPLRELTALPRPLATFKGPTSMGREVEGRGKGEGRERNGRFPRLL